MASLGTFYLLLGAPFVLFVLAAQLRSLRPLSRYHRVAFYSAVAYLPVWLVTIACGILYALRTSSGD